MKTRSMMPIAAAALAVGALAAPLTGSAETKTWKSGVASGAFANGANWEGGTAPTAADNVAFPASGTFAVDMGAGANTAKAKGVAVGKDTALTLSSTVAGYQFMYFENDQPGWKLADDNATITGTGCMPLFVQSGSGYYTLGTNVSFRCGEGCGYLTLQSVALAQVKGLRLYPDHYGTLNLSTPYGDAEGTDFFAEIKGGGVFAFGPLVYKDGSVSADNVKGTGTVRITVKDGVFGAELKGVAMRPSAGSTWKKHGAVFDLSDGASVTTKSWEYALDIGTEGASTVRFSGTAPTMTCGKGTGIELGANTTIELAPQQDWSATVGRITGYLNADGTALDTSASAYLKISDKAHYVIDVTAFADITAPKTFRVASGRSSDTRSELLTMPVPADEYVTLVGEGADRLTATFAVTEVKGTKYTAMKYLDVTLAPCPVKVWKNKTIAVVGDSYSTWDGETGVQAPYYPNAIVTARSQMWWAQAVANLGGTIGNVCAAGGSMISRYSTTYSIDTFENRIKKGELGNPDVILVLGGLNDLWNTVPLAEFEPAFESLAGTLDTVYPNAEKHLLVIKRESTAADDKWGGMSEEYRRLYEKISAKHGFGLIDLQGAYTFKTGLDSDAHLNVAGHAAVGARVAERVREMLAPVDKYTYLVTDNKGYFITSHVPNGAKTTIEADVQFCDAAKTQPLFLASELSLGTALSANFYAAYYFPDMTEDKKGQVQVYVTNTDGGMDGHACFPEEGFTDTRRHVIRVAGDKGAVDGNTWKADWTAKDQLAGGPLALFAASYGKGFAAFSQLRCYSFKIWDGDVLVHNYVPAKNAEGQATLYDVVAKQFLTPVNGAGLTVEKRSGLMMLVK